MEQAGFQARLLLGDAVCQALFPLCCLPSILSALFLATFLAVLFLALVLSVLFLTVFLVALEKFKLQECRHL